MSTPGLRLPSPLGNAHPVVLSRRRQELLAVGLGALIPLALGLAISTQISHPSLVLLLALSAGGVAIAALLSSPRYEFSLVLVALYLGLLEGPAKLGTGAHETASVVRDVLIFSVSIGCVMRIVVKRERVSLPPLSAWAIGFVAIVLAEAFNPNTQGIVKALGGFRQQLEWVPFFFFGYAIMRSKERFRSLFLVLGVIALANGIVSTYQTRLSPGQLAGWGPGYRELVYGTLEVGKKGGLGARTYAVEGIARVRPPGLGTDAGFGGGVGVVALAGTLALLAFGRVWGRRWPIAILCLGALLGVATGLGRLQVVGAVIALVAFIGLSMSAGKRFTKPIGAMLAVFALAIPAGVALVSLEGAGTFSRYTSIAPENVASSKDKKTSSLTHIPKQLEAAPFGVGLGTVGAAAGFGGKQTSLLEGHGVSAETEYNFLADELGLPGLLLWAGFTVRLLTLGLGGLLRVKDVELRIYLAALLSTLIAFTIIGFSGPTMSSAAFGPFFWFAAGTIAYWFAGPGRAAQSSVGVAVG
jgi:hypothetical protein